ncbi:MAG: hypothetical protein MJ058_07080 [Akkermansia sp.]|nr:hypothetical protein [Akkermansia sp.]
MKLPFMKHGAAGLLLSQLALAAVILALPSCSGGGKNEGTGIVRDISPHDLIPEGALQTEVRILGIHVTQDGWEIGTDPNWDPGIPGATPDPTESPLIMEFHPDGATANTGTVTVTLPFQSVTDADAGAPPVLTGTWWQAPRTGAQEQHNTLMYINFTVEGPVRTVAWCIGKGENICLHLRRNILDPLGTVYVGAVMEGTFTLEGLFHEVHTTDGMHIVDPTCNLDSQPCIVTVGGWTPEEE